MEPRTDLRPAAVAALDSILSGLELLERRARAIEANRLELLTGILGLVQHPNRSSSLARSSELAHRAVRAEIGVALGLSEYAVDAQLALAFSLTHHYEQAHLVLESGDISLAHARVIVDAGTVIGAGDESHVRQRRAAYESAVLEHAVRENPARLRPIARRLAEHYAEQPIDERHSEAVKLRRVTVTDHEDGMADLTAHLPAVEAHAIYDRLTRMGRRVKLAGRVCEAERAAHAESITAVDAKTASDAPDPAEMRDARGIDAIRTDVFSDLLLAGEGTMLAGTGLEAIRGRVQVTVPIDELLRARKEPPTSSPSAYPPASSSSSPSFLTAHGPIPAESARILAGTAFHWDAVVARAETGDVLAVDTYRPTEAMRRHLCARDIHCRFPGCRAPLSRCDLDHTVDAAFGGATAIDNLSALCRGHHTLKHHTGWGVEQRGNGVLEWRSPAGRTYTDRPPSRVHFRAVADTEPPGSCGSRRRSSPVREPVPTPTAPLDDGAHPF